MLVKINHGGLRPKVGRPKSGRQVLAQIQIPKKAKKALEKEKNKTQTWEEFLLSLLDFFKINSTPSE